MKMSNIFGLSGQKITQKRHVYHANTFLRRLWNNWRSGFSINIKVVLRFKVKREKNIFAGLPLALAR